MTAEIGIVIEADEVERGSQLKIITSQARKGCIMRNELARRDAPKHFCLLAKKIGLSNREEASCFELEATLVVFISDWLPVERYLIEGCEFVAVRHCPPSPVYFGNGVEFLSQVIVKSGQARRVVACGPENSSFIVDLPPDDALVVRVMARQFLVQAMHMRSIQWVEDSNKAQSAGTILTPILIDQ